MVPDTAQQQAGERLDPHALRTNLAWLLRLRWGAIAGQAATIAGVHFLMGIALPLVPLFAIVLVELASNVALLVWARGRARVHERVLAAVMAADVLLLTLLLDFTGGPSNPFNFLYLVHIALAAVVLRSRFTWALLGLSFACSGALFLEPSWQAGMHAGHAGHAGHPDMRMHLYGMWIAFGVAAVFIAYFVTRVTTDLARREHELAEARALASRSERLAALATLAAGAAHELSTPLSTIAVAARELERSLARDAQAHERSADAQLIREEVARCREILTRMAADAAPDAADMAVAVTLAQLVEAALSGLPDRDGIAIAIDPTLQALRLTLPLQGVTQALRCVLQNAQHAVQSGGEICVRAARDGERCRIEVHDSGSGMPKEVLARAGEPFFTTKEPGRGMGLGLFVSRAALERVGGQLELRAADSGPGTVATLRLPLGRCDNLPHGAALHARASLTS